MVTIGINRIVIAQLTLQKLPMIHLLALHMSRMVGGITGIVAVDSHLEKYSVLFPYWTCMKSYKMNSWPMSNPWRNWFQDILLFCFTFLWSLLISKIKKRGMLFIASGFSPVERILLLSLKTKESQSIESSQVNKSWHRFESWPCKIIENPFRQKVTNLHTIKTWLTVSEQSSHQFSRIPIRRIFHSLRRPKGGPFVALLLLFFSIRWGTSLPQPKAAQATALCQETSVCWTASCCKPNSCPLLVLGGSGLVAAQNDVETCKTTQNSNVFWRS